MSEAPCLECGEVTELLLGAHITHICIRCLFPPRKPDEDKTADAPQYLPTVSLIQKLQTLNTSLGSIRPEQKRLDGGW